MFMLCFKAKVDLCALRQCVHLGSVYSGAVGDDKHYWGDPCQVEFMRLLCIWIHFPESLTANTGMNDAIQQAIDEAIYNTERDTCIKFVKLIQTYIDESGYGHTHRYIEFTKGHL